VGRVMQQLGGYYDRLEVVQWCGENC